MPNSASLRLNHCALVSRFWPLVNSLPMEITSAFMVSHKSAGGLVILFTATAAFLQKLRHQAIGQRGLVAERPLWFEPGRDIGMRVSQAAHKRRPEGWP